MSKELIVRLIMSKERLEHHYKLLPNRIIQQLLYMKLIIQFVLHFNGYEYLSIFILFVKCYNKLTCVILQEKT